MSNATDSETTVTMEDVRDMKARREELREKLEDYANREEELSSELAHLHADGEGDSERAEEVQAERREVRDTVSDLEAALEVLDQRIEEATEEAAAGEAGVEIASLRKSVGGISGQHAKDLEKAEELADELVTVLRRLEGNRARQLHLQALAEALADRFDHDTGEFKVLDPDAVEGAERLRKQTAQRLADAPATPGREVAGVDLPPSDKALEAARGLRQGWNVEDPRAVELLELVDSEMSRDMHRVKRKVRERDKKEKEARATAAAVEIVGSIVTGPTAINGLFRELQEADLPPSDRGADKLLTAAADELDLKRVKDGSNNHFYVPAEFDLGDTYRPAGRFE